MKIVKEYPPNYETICKAIPAVRKRKTIVFTYGDTIYVPSGVKLSADIIAHEEVHERQQLKMGKDNWWKIYLENPHFRADQELEAYRRQALIIKETMNRATRRKALKAIAGDFSGEMYGKIVTKEEALNLIGGKDEQLL